MPKRVNWAEVIGKKFRRLTALELVGRDAAHKMLIRCRCECGAEITVRYNNLATGGTKSCGCLESEITVARNYKHGYSRHPDFQVWVDMNKRCHGSNPNFTKNYKDRGISVCERWRVTPEAFFNDMGPRPVGSTLERVDNNQGYSPDNCIWASMRDQQNNKRTNVFLELDGVVLTIGQWAEKLGIHKGTLRGRYVKGWEPREILTTPVDMSHSRKKAA